MKRVPYRSAENHARDPLVAQGLNLDDFELENDIDWGGRAQLGAMEYWIDGPPLSTILDAGLRTNTELVGKQHADKLQRIRMLCDLLYEMFAHYWWHFRVVFARDMSQLQTIMVAVVHKGLIALAGVQQLTLTGLYSHADPLLRYILEGALLAKMCGANPDVDLFDKWIDGLKVNCGRALGMYVREPTLKALPDLWAELSEGSHFRTSSGQISLMLEPGSPEVSRNLGLTEVLLHLLWHIAGRHLITPGMRRLQARTIESHRTREIANSARALLKESRNALHPGLRIHIREFQAPWCVQ
jgi:hypothetical protein